ncbi:MAG TPA: hypothetical protein VNJ28_05440 [Candidatus Limnocylindrales bacterium]|nr:hypothetical protein [Candidatus Limnocylindrales bacterium]
MTASPLERLIGTWQFEPTIDGRSTGTGRATFEWIAGGAFVLLRMAAEWTDPGWREHAPRAAQAVIGFDDTTGEVTEL